MTKQLNSIMNEGWRPSIRPSQRRVTGDTPARIHSSNTGFSLRFSFPTDSLQIR